MSEVFNHSYGTRKAKVLGYNDGSALITITQGDSHANIPLERDEVEALYNALGEHLYGPLDEYDAEAIMAAESRKEALLADFKALIGYTEPTPKFDALFNRPSPFSECSYDLRMQGKAYPRTCKVHGLSPCPM